MTRIPVYMHKAFGTKFSFEDVRSVRGRHDLIAERLAAAS